MGHFINLLFKTSFSYFLQITFLDLFIIIKGRLIKRLNGIYIFLLLIITARIMIYFSFNFILRLFYHILSNLIKKKLSLCEYVIALTFAILNKLLLHHIVVLQNFIILLLNAAFHSLLLVLVLICTAAHKIMSIIISIIMINTIKISFRKILLFRGTFEKFMYWTSISISYIIFLWQIRSSIFSWRYYWWIEFILNFLLVIC